MVVTRPESAPLAAAQHEDIPPHQIRLLLLVDANPARIGSGSNISSRLDFLFQAVDIQLAAAHRSAAPACKDGRPYDGP